MPREFKPNDTVVVVLPAKLYNKDAEGSTFIRGTYDSRYKDNHIVNIHLYGGAISIQEVTNGQLYTLEEIGTAAAGIIKESTHTNPTDLVIASEP